MEQQLQRLDLPSMDTHIQKVLSLVGHLPEQHRHIEGKLEILQRQQQELVTNTESDHGEIVKVLKGVKDIRRVMLDLVDQGTTEQCDNRDIKDAVLGLVTVLGQ